MYTRCNVEVIWSHDDLGERMGEILRTFTHPSPKGLEGKKRKHPLGVLLKKTIKVEEKTKERLEKHGNVGDTYEDVIRGLLDKVESLEGAK